MCSRSCKLRCVSSVVNCFNMACYTKYDSLVSSGILCHNVNFLNDTPNE